MTPDDPHTDGPHEAVPGSSPGQSQGGVVPSRDGEFIPVRPDKPVTDPGTVSYTHLTLPTKRIV